MRVTEGQLGKDREGGLSAQRTDTPPKYLSACPHRQTAHAPKDTSLQPMGHIWLIGVLLFHVSGLFFFFFETFKKGKPNLFNVVCSDKV